MLPMTLAPIALFAYNRLAHTQQTVEALLRNDLASESEVCVFSDGPKSAADSAKVDSVRSYLQSLRGFRSLRVVKQPCNLGLAHSIIAGVSEICRSHGRVIAVEDDLVTSPYFLRFMNEALARYETDPEVIS